MTARVAKDNWLSISQDHRVSFPAREVERMLASVRKACLGLPETSERLSHGGPSFFIRDKSCFVMFLNDHHGDGRLAVWCAAPEGVQAELTETDPERFFRPPYVGHRGWIGVQLLGPVCQSFYRLPRPAGVQGGRPPCCVPLVSDAELEVICREAFIVVAPPTVRRLLDR